MPLSRRQFLLTGAASGALLFSRSWPAGANLLGSSSVTAASRASRLGSRLSLVHADLHNHSLLSDGDGQADLAFASMRANGVDVAALTDHAGVAKLQGDACQGCAAAVGIDESEWRRIGALAQAADTAGAFTAIRGFEWSSPTLGHMNVWFSNTWTDPLATGGVGAEAGGAFLLHQDSNPLPTAVTAQINDILRTSPTTSTSMAGFYEWMNADPSRPVLGGGSDGLAGFNHPGREGGRFGFFTFDPTIAERVVSIEVFNRGEDYLFEQTDTVDSPIVECLDKGWKVGFLGVSDEHGTEWGKPEGKGRTGLWVTENTQEGVRQALLSRRFFSTRERGLRLDATANDVAMGGTVRHQKTTFPVEVALDIDKGTEWVGKPLRLQVLQTGSPLPTIVHEVDVTVPSADHDVIRFTIPAVNRDAGDWISLRVTDPTLPADSRAPSGSGYAAAGRAVAYASPFFLAAGGGGPKDKKPKKEHPGRGQER